MFTGLVQAVGEVVEVASAAAGSRLVVDPRGWGHRPGPGESISIGGCCLTLAELKEDGLLRFDVVPETLRRTTLGSLGPGSRVNLEACCTPTTLLGGHIVQGHVDGVGEVVGVVTEGEYRVRVRPPAELMEFVTPKGSVCIDGVSLTVAGLEREWFEVALIPTTLRETTLGEVSVGSRVNVEMDVVVKAVVYWARNYGRG